MVKKIILTLEGKFTILDDHYPVDKAIYWHVGKVAGYCTSCNVDDVKETKERLVKYVCKQIRKELKKKRKVLSKLSNLLNDQLIEG